METARHGKDSNPRTEGKAEYGVTTEPNRLNFYLIKKLEILHNNYIKICNFNSKLDIKILYP